MSQIRWAAAELLAAPFAAATSAPGMPVIRIGIDNPDFFVPEVFFHLPPPPAPEPAGDESDEIAFSIPRYQLSAQDRETVAACLVPEAACQGDFGMRGVMAVIRNRAEGNPELFTRTVLPPYQFSALNDTTTGRTSLWRAIQRAKKDRMWSAALQIVDEAVLDSWHDPTGGATHYTRTGERTRWTRRLAKTTTIGAHSFYR